MRFRPASAKLRRHVPWLAVVLVPGAVVVVVLVVPRRRRATELTEAILTRLEDAVLLSRLVSLLPAVLARLGDGGAWRGFSVGPAAVASQSATREGGTRDRLLCRDRLFDRAHGRTYSLAVHRFGDVGAKTALHDHRSPLAVFPFGDVGTPVRAPLYEMPWERREVDDRGVLEVRDIEPWAIVDHRRVWHAVHSRAVHFSVVLADVTDPPTRPDRLTSRKLTFLETRAPRRSVERALRAALAGR